MFNKKSLATKVCKHCATEIPYEAKVCPQCRKRVKRNLLKWVFIAVVIFFVGVLLVGGEDDGTKKVGEIDAIETSATSAETRVATADIENSDNESSHVENKAEPAKELQSEYHVGDVLWDGDIKIVYMSSGEHLEYNEFMQPEPGYKYIYLQFAFENTSDTSNASVSCFDFSGYADGYAVDMYYGADEALSATLSSGRSTTGYVYFIVPETATDIDVEYETNALTSEKINFVYEGEKESDYALEANIAPTEPAYHVGDIVESGDLLITFLSWEEYLSDNMFMQPKDGYHYISCEFEFENIGSHEEYIISSDFDCYADGVSCAATYIREDDISATLSSGRKAKGTVTFEVPDSASVVEVEYIADYWASNQVVFAVN